MRDTSVIIAERRRGIWVPPAALDGPPCAAVN
jgi:hypothetical protein